MAFPDVVIIRPFTYHIHCDTDSWNALVIDEDGASGLVGRTAHHECLITIKPTLPDSMKAETLLHEILHAIHEVGAQIETIRYVDELEEALTQKNTPVLLNFIRDNPKIIGYLQHGDF